MDIRLSTLDILKTLHQLTGARISLHSLNFKEIAAYPENIHPFCEQIQTNSEGKKKCTYADALAFNTVRETGKPYAYKCHCGLIEAVAPIYNYGVLSGYFMMGQLICDEESDHQQILKHSKKYFPDRENAVAGIKSIPTTNYDKINNYFDILVIVAEYMTQTNRLTENRCDLASSVSMYIQRFYSAKISITSMCEHFSCSRTTLMNAFRKKYGMTIGDYITEHRLQQAKDMLDKSGKSIKAIALDCGFTDQNYFSKVFYKKFGKTPTNYRQTSISHIHESAKS